MFNKSKLLFAALFLGVVTASAAVKPEQLLWCPADGMPVLGTLCPDASKAYSRLPDSLEQQIRPEVWALGKNSAGLSIRFRSDASALGFKWKSLNKFNMNHMTATGIRGLDLYALDSDGTWQTVSSVRPAFHHHHTTAMAITDMEPVMREYMLYLPLYDGVDSIFIGTDSAAVVLPPAVDLPRRDKPVVMYGTSILQGGCASRPGMAHPSILGRMLNREVINLGFSGNARLDYEIAHLIAESDPSVVVLDMLPNCSKELLDERLVTFYNIIRDSLPDVPIVMVESPLFPVMKWNTETQATITEKNLTLQRIYDDLRLKDNNLHYVEGNILIPNRETTVDNYHFTDTGFANFAKAIYPLINELINANNEN